MDQKPTYEELEQRIKALNREIATHERTESEQLSHLRFLEIMDQIDQVIRRSDDIGKIMKDVLETVLEIFLCDRAWLMYPCDPESDFWRVPMECTRSEYPGAFELNQDIPMTSEMVESLKAVLRSKGPLVFHPEQGLPLPDSAKQFSIQSSMNSALYPKVGKPWMLGLSQCSHARQWTEAEISIFQEIGRRVSDSLSLLLTLQNLKESEEKYRHLSEGAFEAVVWHDGGKIIEANEQYYNMFGYKPEELADKDAILLTATPDSAKLMKEQISSGHLGPYEVVGMKKGGAEFPIEIRVKKMQYKEKMVRLAAIRDLTTRKQTLERTERLNRLNEKLLGFVSLQEKLRLITDEIVHIFKADFARIWMIKPGDLCDSECQHAKTTEGPHVCRYRESCLHLLASSGRYTHIDGGHRRVPLGCYKIGRVAAEDEPKFLTNNVINDPRIHDHQWAQKLGLVSFAGYRLLSATNRVMGVLALFSQQAISSEEDAHLESIAGTTAQVIQTTLAEEALRKSEEKYRYLVENANSIILRMDVDGNVTFFNEFAQRFFGYTEKEILGRNVVGSIVPETESTGRDLRAMIEDIGRNPDRYVTNENENMCHDGTRVWIAWTNKPIYDETGAVFEVLCVGNDITDRKRAEQAKESLQAKLQRSQKMESLGLLAGGVAHDLNNVLSGIVSYPELLLLELPKDSKLRKPIETMQESGNRAAAIVQDLLTVARGVATTKEPLNLNDLVTDYLNSPEFKKLNKFHFAVTFKTNLDSNLLNISGSHVHIRKVIMNLVSNAAEAINGSGKVTLSTINRYVDKPLKGYDDVTVGEYAVLTVSDDGSGILSSDLERIFEPFYTKKVIGRSGTGLGLAVVWNVVQDHEGYVDVKSDENGTTFELYFPITRDELSDKDLSIPIENYQGNGETILVVDDVESQREIACNMLDKLGYKATTVSSGEEAVQYLQKHAVDLILLDMIMAPGLNGRETYERIIQIHPKQKAVIVSGFAETDEVKKAQKLGAGQYLKKPLTLEKMGIAIRDELKK